MLTRGMGAAASGMMGLIDQNDVIANNIANVNTPGFKRSSLIFKNLYNTMIEQPDLNANPKYKELNEVGEMSMGSGVHKLIHEFNQGTLMKTDNPLDIGIQGDGFFKLQGSNGDISYTRNGTFVINNKNELTTEEGEKVLDNLNKPIIIPINELKVRNLNDINITSTGQIELNNDANKLILQTIGVFDFQDKENVDWIGHSKFKLKQDSVNRELKAEKFSLEQKSIESSNTSLVNELVNMINVSRGYETLSKFLKQESDSLSVAINIGKAKG